MSYLMCLYVYYYGKNLHRFGFVRGTNLETVNRKEEYNFDDVMNALSDSEKEFFEGVSGESYKDTGADIDIKSMIEENNRGLISVDELRATVGKKTGTVEQLYQNMDPYSRKIYEEMKKAEKESISFDKHHGLNRSYENMDDDDEDFGAFDDSFFNDLNS